MNSAAPTAGNALRLMLEGGPPPPCPQTLGFRSARVEADTVVLAEAELRSLDGVLLAKASASVVIRKGQANRRPSTP